VHLGVGIGPVLAAVSATLTNVAYLREHDAAASPTALSLRRPLQSLRLLLTDRSWMLGFAMESGGFASYAAALALASLAVVQSIGAGGIGVLAFVSSRVSGRPLTPRQSAGVAVSVLGCCSVCRRLRTAAAADEDRPSGSRPGLVELPPWPYWSSCAAVAAASLPWRLARSVREPAA
jgi:hypothetical protein